MPAKDVVAYAAVHCGKQCLDDAAGGEPGEDCKGTEWRVDAEAGSRAGARSMAFGGREPAQLLCKEENEADRGRAVQAPKMEMEGKRHERESSPDDQTPQPAPLPLARGPKCGEHKTCPNLNSVIVSSMFFTYMAGAMALPPLLDVWHSYRYLFAIVFVGLALLSFLRARQSQRDPDQNEHGTLGLGEEKTPRAADSRSQQLSQIRMVQKPKPIPANAVTQSRTQRSAAPKRIVGSKIPRSYTTLPGSERIQPLVFFSSLAGSTERSAKSLLKDLSSLVTSGSPHLILEPQLHDLSDLDYDQYFLATPKPQNTQLPTSYFYIILIPTYDIDTTLDTFIEHLKEVHHDFRIDTGPLRSLLGYAVFGFGDREGWPTEEESFCSQAREVDKWMARLTGKKRAYPIGMGDVKSDVDDRLEDWRRGVEEVLLDLAAGKSLGEGVPGSGEALGSDEEESAGEEEPESTPKTNGRKPKSDDVADLETLGGSNPGSKPTLTAVPIDFTTRSSTSQSPTQHLKEMVPPSSPTYIALMKQGYSIIGSHSGVKICRWTKSALRGRGSCYKYSFYGIASHLCMETTPSLSCSNKCVFCWRHGTNPVGTTWRWQVDPPDLVFAGVKKAHYSKIKMMRGVPGVLASRFEEAMRIRHCALSLVGEPIFYPHINEFVDLLHAERISSFLVCNAQHPVQLAALKRVTQLYVSIDASNKASLRAIDRPLHRDFWERFTSCLDILREKRHVQRTVFRLTLVKGFNLDEEAEEYAALVARGLPCFIEVKGVTYCGTSTSKGAGLSMANVPFYDEICAFVIRLNDALARRGLAYGLAAEHAHSCCILLASERFKSEGKWNTTIDYVRFFELLESGKEFRPEDYMAPTPEWALWGRGGFDPRDARVDRKGRPREASEREGVSKRLEREGLVATERVDDPVDAAVREREVEIF